MIRTVALLLCACSTAQETATKEPRKVEFEAVVNEEGGRAASPGPRARTSRRRLPSTARKTRRRSSGSGISAVKQQVAASLMEAELPALDLEVQVAEDKTATFSHAEGGDLNWRPTRSVHSTWPKTRCRSAHHLVQGAVQKAQQLAAAEEGGAAAAEARPRGAGARRPAGHKRGGGVAGRSGRARRAREARPRARRRPRPRQSRPRPRKSRRRRSGRRRTGLG